MEDNTNIGPKDLLIGKYLSGNSSLSEAEELLNWLALDENNRIYYNQYKMIWIQSCRKDPDTEADYWEQLLIRIESRENDTLKIKEHSFRILKYAAVLTGLIVLSAVYFYFFKTKPSNKPVAQNIIEVPYGSKMNLTLPDRSKLWINSGSKVIYNNRFGIDNRRIKIIGEAFFEVAKNPKLPFIVQAGNVKIRAVGTAFNVKAYPEEKLIETTLVRGSVEVNKDGEEKSVLLKPSEKIIIKNVYKSKENTNLASSKIVKGNKKSLEVEDTVDIAISQAINIEKETAWKEGKLIFEREPLETLTTKLMRKYDVSFLFQDEELKSFRFTGAFKDLSLEQIMEALRFSAPINYEIVEKQVILKPKN